ncbi:UDP-N-acetylmuramoyl-L-alanine--D-glutamate ligase [Desulfosarcina ovata]|uniref:UDP-N-acetylmuramoylalanine--D-glutamate ligase n=1 Tax=Desulfosarcina ovata subsp. ovata TaxID=2752305 RepID=A0A5K8AG21_9BACT|nr:UDP-N-acetylmuramoyl-L-alanine--D-glutamate ligase [Desulfosarcina ovata]BBO91635.1 UDP-N-acetylmuramoylalanine--D-glutamate ligase [Desulfosarcina ovata subsp. ovata]
MDLNNKRVVVVGLGRSGVATVRFLVRQGARVTVSDRAAASALKPAIDALAGLDVRLKLGGHDTGDFEHADLVVLSPGVPHTQPILEPAWAAGIPVIGEMELAAAHVQAPIIAVTGTNGKTTTTELVGRMLKNSGKRVFVGGNIGTPLIAYADGAYGTADVIVAETSSFQLDTTVDFRPATAVVLNITDDHLDRYAGFSAYAASKWRIFANQDPGDLAVFNAMDATVAGMLDRVGLRARRQPFSDQPLNQGAQITGDAIVIMENGRRTAIFSLAKSALIGPHNRENIAAACLAARAHGASREGIQQTIDTFGGLAHRVEPVGTVRGVRFVNDSKATNVDAVKRALECFDVPVVLIMGGQNKKGDFSRLKALVRRRVKTLVVLGQARDEIVTALAGDPRAGIIEVATMDEAVTQAFAAAEDGEAVLLSPACASFDMFDSYAHRGDCFRKAVERLL